MRAEKKGLLLAPILLLRQDSRDGLPSCTGLRPSHKHQHGVRSRVDAGSSGMSVGIRIAIPSAEEN